MIRRGRQDDILLFEVTEQDLLDSELVPTSYQVGNVLLFDSQQSIRIGSELARADDILCAVEFLSNGAFSAACDCETDCDCKTECNCAHEHEEADDSSLEPPEPSTEKTLHDEIMQLKLYLEQRDGLLSDFSERLRVQQDENQLLNLLLEQTQFQIALESASRDELMDDLKQVSASTQMVELNLEHVMEEKFMLEQELAEKITELIESSMINDDLRRQMEDAAEHAPEPATLGTVAFELAGSEVSQTMLAAELESSSEPGVVPAVVGAGLTAPDLVVETELSPLSAPVLERENSQVLTMSSGKLIHVYHEFPSLTKRRPLQVLTAFGQSLSKALGLLVLTALVTLLASVVATSLTNHVSMGEALDMIMKSSMRLFRGY
jgi:hypothetical protein